MTSGAVRFKGEDVTSWAPDARAKAGMFLAFQHPEAIAGVPVLQFLRQAMSARQGIDLSVLEVRMEMLDWMKRLGIDEAFGVATAERGLLWRRAQAQRGAPVGPAQSRGRDPGRDGLRARHRLSRRRRQRRQGRTRSPPFSRGAAS